MSSTWNDPDAVIAATAASEAERSLRACTATNRGSRRRSAAEAGLSVERTIACPTTDAASSNRRNSKQYISVQLQDAREKFSNIAETNSTALKIMAESLERLATVEERKVKIEERRATSEKMCLQLLKNISETLKHFCEK